MDCGSRVPNLWAQLKRSMNPAEATPAGNGDPQARLSGCHGSCAADLSRLHVNQCNISMPAYGYSTARVVNSLRLGDVITTVSGFHRNADAVQSGAIDKGAQECTIGRQQAMQPRLIVIE